MEDTVGGHALLHFTKFSNLSSMVKSRFWDFLVVFGFSTDLVTWDNLEVTVIILTLSQSLLSPMHVFKTVSSTAIKRR